MVTFAWRLQCQWTPTRYQPALFSTSTFSLSPAFSFFPTLNGPFEECLTSFARCNAVMKPRRDIPTDEAHSSRGALFAPLASSICLTTRSSTTGSNSKVVSDPEAAHAYHTTHAPIHVSNRHLWAKRGRGRCLFADIIAVRLKNRKIEERWNIHTCIQSNFYYQQQQQQHPYVCTCCWG